METGIFKGVYSSVDPRRGGAAAPGRVAPRKRYWFVWERKGGYVVQPLSASMEAAGERRPLAAAELARSYTFEPAILAMPIRQGKGEATPVERDEGPFAVPLADEARPAAGRPEIRRPAEATGFAQAERAGQAEQAEQAGQAEHAERVLRADFATALARLRRGDREGAVRELERLADVPGEFAPAHRHMFTDFGISLRKSKLPRIAIRHHLRALDLSPGDSHVHFNIARAYYDMGDMERAEEHLRSSLALTPDLDPSRRFLEFLLESGAAATNAEGNARKGAR